MEKSQAVAASLVLTIGVLWGLNWPAVKYILGWVPPWTFRALAFSLGALLLAIISRTVGEGLRVPKQDRAALVGAGLLTVFGFNILTAFGQLLTETSKAAIIAFTMPMWAAIFSSLLLKETLGINRLMSLVLGMGGLVVLLNANGAEYLEHPAGFVVMLGAAISWAGGTVLLKGHPWSIGPVARSAWLVGVSALPAVAGAVLLEHPWALSWPPLSVVAVFIYHVVGPVAICYAAWTILIVRLPASTAALGTLLVPVVGVLSSSLLIGDELTLPKLAALALIVASVVVVLVRPFARRRG
jgi:drug/metabolite transporter (DMT)-like permease